jgi:phytoene synthase
MRLHPPKRKPARLQLRAAYAICRSIARTAAKNFYYGFMVLPGHKRNAMCAVYAYMRHADDISDDPSFSTEDRRARLNALRDSLHRVVAGEPTDDPVLLALADTQRRYNIPLDWLNKLVEGTAMDVQPAAVMSPPESGTSALGTAARVGTVTTQQAQSQPATYETFDDLYKYCYHVASVVGLVCIRIFGYRDPAAEPLAERCGIAFQLTNIIRDVKEDAEMGRIYLPLEDMRRFDRCASELELRTPSGDGSPSSGMDTPPDLAERFRPVLEFEASRAREYYRSAEELLPFIEDDSRPALWVLVQIYSRLLEKIARRNYDVFGPKVRLTVPEKLSILAQGFWKRLI